MIDRLIQAAQLPNARSVTARVEDLARVPASLGGGAGAYDAVTARAVGPLAVLVEYAAPLLVVGGRFVAWKGARDADEERGGEEAGAIVARVVHALGLHATVDIDESDEEIRETVNGDDLGLLIGKHG